MNIILRKFIWIFGIMICVGGFMFVASQAIITESWVFIILSLFFIGCVAFLVAITEEFLKENKND